MHRYAEDVALLAELGVDAYRFSVSWPRVQPDRQRRGLGRGPRLLRPPRRHAAGRGRPAVGDALPLGPPRRSWRTAGGWPDRDVVDRFAEYAVAVHAALGDRVRHWTTLNEPWCSAWLGYGQGEHAPGRADRRLAARAAHHLLLAHGRRDPRAARPGAAGPPARRRPQPVPGPRRAGKADDPVVAEAVRIVDGVQNRWWLDAAPSAAATRTTCSAILAPCWTASSQDGDLAEINAPLDLLGVNYYNDQLVDAGGPPERTLSGAYPVAAEVTAGEPEGPRRRWAGR